MINKKAFAELREQLEQFDSEREQIIKQSRDVLKLSKAAIYSLHRNEQATAEQQLANAKKAITAINKLVTKDVHHATTGPYLEALEEYTEAACYYWFVTKRKLPTHDDLGVDADTYLGGMCDLVGELVRKAVNSIINNDPKTALEIRDVVAELYEELMLFDFRNGPIRRKYDAIKYGLEKLEDLALQLKLKK